MLPVKKCHVHKRVKFYIQIYFCFQCQAVQSGSPLTGGYHQRVMRNCTLQLTETFSRSLTSWKVPTFDIGPSWDTTRIQGLSLLSPRQELGLHFSALLRSSGAWRNAGLPESPCLLFHRNTLRPTKAHFKSHFRCSRVHPFFLYCWYPLPMCLQHQLSYYLQLHINPFALGCYTFFSAAAITILLRVTMG